MKTNPLRIVLATLFLVIAGDARAQITIDTTITYENSFSGPYAVLDDALGPGAEISPMDQATTTVAFPLAQEVEGVLYEGVNYTYVRETASAAFNMGGFFEDDDGPSQDSYSIREPDGDQDYAFPMTMGNSWSSMYASTIFFGGDNFPTDFEKEYEVDGWGVALLPSLG